MGRRQHNDCLDCQAVLAGAHHNRKRCALCAQNKRYRPTHTLTEQQQQRVLELAGTVTQNEIVADLGVSRANVIRFARDKNISLRKVLYPPKLVAQVLACYEAHGKAETRRRFPDIALRSLVEHRVFKYDYAPRQVRFTDDDYRVLVRMGALVPYSVQAQHLNRPNAHEGSIKSFWVKNVRAPATNLQGLAPALAKFICEPDVPFVKVPPVQSERGAYGRTIVLWCDAELYLLPWVPGFVREAVQAMAAYQRWLYQTDRPGEVIRDIIEWGRGMRDGDVNPEQGA